MIKKLKDRLRRENKGEVEEVEVERQRQGLSQEGAMDIDAALANFRDLSQKDLEKIKEFLGFLGYGSFLQDLQEKKNQDYLDKLARSGVIAPIDQIDVERLEQMRNGPDSSYDDLPPPYPYRSDLQKRTAYDLVQRREMMRRSIEQMGNGNDKKPVIGSRRFKNLFKKKK